METYITLGKYTQQGAAAIKESPARAAMVRQAIEQAGGKWIGFYLTLGQYDFVLISQGPDAKTVVRILLMAVGQGNVATETLRAFTMDEFKAIVDTLP